MGDGVKVDFTLDFTLEETEDVNWDFFLGMEWVKYEDQLGGDGYYGFWDEDEEILYVAQEA